ncbi:cell wall-associated NlpC family hydrolase [Modestobacter versicolor]|uniref:Cell wall-associated NlpC family hydrolase n=1 Tax=Modestobacter versicolor TaxID=429133 RepID=A0A839Y864_9ACTN|nr:cell wall-associated NlpC family hydrolase [Modestobacter versicolor]
MPAPRAQSTAPRPRPRTRTGATPPARRPAAGRSTSTARPRPPANGRRPAPRKGRPAPRTRTPGVLRHWGRRLAVLGSSTLAIITVLAAFAQPPTEAGQVPQPTDATGQAQTTAATLAAATTRYRAALAEATAFQTQAQQARDAGATAVAAVSADRATVGAYADAAYRRTADERWPLAQLSVRSPGSTTDVLHAQGLAEQLTRAQDAQVARTATAAVRAAQFTDAARDAESAAAAARAEAAAVLVEVRGLVATLDPTVSAQWAALGTSPTATAQQERNSAALADWQGYLGLLSAAGITPPPAAALLDAGALPEGLAPLRDGTGTPIAGVATAFAGGRLLTVLPAETVAAVSAAFSQLGKPYLVDRDGPDGYSCAGLTSTVWTQAGIGLTSDLAQQWAQGTPVPVGQLQVGDLVFSTDPRTGLDDVGLYLGGSSVLSASADRWQVAVRDVVDLSAAVRVTVPPASPAAPPAAATGVPPTCSAPLPAPGTTAGPVSGAWGGWSNGQIPREELCSIGGGHRLRCDAAAAYNAMSAAYAAAFGTPLCITDSYRSLSAQVDAHHRKPRITAVPGTSNHGWALAVDLCGGVNVFGTAQTAWMQGHAGDYGWVHPDWAQADGQNPEPWHWEYGSLT